MTKTLIFLNFDYVCLLTHVRTLRKKNKSLCAKKVSHSIFHGEICSAVAHLHKNEPEETCIAWVYVLNFIPCKYSRKY